MKAITKRVFVPVLPATVNYVEKWLSKMARKGWVLSGFNGFLFVFQKKNPKTAKFLVCKDLPKDEMFSKSFYTVKHHYGKRKAKINKFSTNIVEIDIGKIDKNLYDYVSFRNKYYLKHYIYMLVIFICISFFIYWLGYIDAEILPIVFPYFWIVNLYNLYCFISIIALVKTGDGSMSSSDTTE